MRSEAGRRASSSSLRKMGVALLDTVMPCLLGAWSGDCDPRRPVALGWAHRLHRMPSRDDAPLPLARLLGHTADAVAGVRAGRSLTEMLGQCPLPARAGTQALAFHVMRCLGGATVVRSMLAPKSPPPAVDALLTTALALLWPPEPP